MKISVIGTGYVGLVAGTCFAETGNDVICVDIDEKKIAGLQKGKLPIYEPGLGEVIRRNLEEKRLTFTTDLEWAVQNSLIIFIAVGTPAKQNGASYLKYVLEVARGVARVDLPPRTSPPSKLDLGPLEVHSPEQNRVLVTWEVWPPAPEADRPRRCEAVSGCTPFATSRLAPLLPTTCRRSLH